MLVDRSSPTCGEAAAAACSDAPLDRADACCWLRMTMMVSLSILLHCLDYCYSPRLLEGDSAEQTARSSLTSGALAAWRTPLEADSTSQSYPRATFSRFLAELVLSTDPVDTRWQMDDDFRMGYLAQIEAGCGLLSD
jgi:hypothetical protein